MVKDVYLERQTDEVSNLRTPLNLRVTPSKSAHPNLPDQAGQDSRVWLKGNIKE